MVSAQQPTGADESQYSNTSPNETPQEAPAQEAPAQEVPAQEVPVQEPPAQATPQEAPSQGSAAERQYVPPPSETPPPPAAEGQTVAPEPVADPATDPAPASQPAEDASTADPSSAPAEEIAEPQPAQAPVAEDPVAPTPTEEPLPSDPQPSVAPSQAEPQAEPVGSEDEGAVRPSSHCGLFGPGPPEGTPCTEPAPTPPADDPEQYQYPPAPTPPPGDPGQYQYDPPPLPTPPDEAPPGETGPVVEPAPPAPEPQPEEPAPGEPPAEEVPPGSFEYGVCEDDPQFCGIEGLDPTYACQPVYAGGSDGSVHHYECFPAKGNGAPPPADADVPEGQYCSEVLYYESPDSEGQKAYTCEDPATDRVCAYDAATGEELYCGVDASAGQIGDNPQEEPCGEDACGLENIPADFECTRYLDDQGATISYGCYKSEFEGPDGSRCSGLIRLDENGEPLSGGEAYKCQETSPGPASCRIYDADFNYIRDCDNGGGSLVPPVAFDKSDKATDAIANSRDGSDGPKKQATSGRDPSAKRSDRDPSAEGEFPSGDPSPGGALGSPAPEFAPAEQGKPDEGPGVGDNEPGGGEPGGSDSGASKPDGSEPGASAFVGGVSGEGAFREDAYGEGAFREGAFVGGVFGEGGVSGGDAAPGAQAGRTGAVTSTAAAVEVILASLVGLLTASEPTRTPAPGEAVATLAGATDVAPSTPVNGLGSLGERSLASASVSFLNPAASPVEAVVPLAAGMQADEEGNNGLADRPDARRIAFVAPEGGGFDAGSSPRTEARFAGVSSPTAVAAVALLAAAVAAAVAWRTRRRDAGR